MHVIFLTLPEKEVLKSYSQDCLIKNIRLQSQAILLRNQGMAVQDISEVLFPACRYDGDDAAIEALDEQLDRRDVRTREPLGESVRAQEHRPAYDLVGVRRAHTARVASQEPQLELLGHVFGDVRGHETTEPRVHAVGVLSANRVDELARGTHSVLCALRHLGGSTTDRGVPHVDESEILAGEDDRPRHGPSLNL